MLLPENQAKKYERLFVDIDTGAIKIPNFQRGFVWNLQQTAKLIDSMIKGFPIGTFIIWKTKEELGTHRNIGNASLPKTPKGDYVMYVLDGQQRITSLFAVRKGIIIENTGSSQGETDYRNISIRLDLPTESTEEVVVPNAPDSGNYISVHELLTANITDVVKKYNTEDIEKIDYYKARLTGYDFPVVVISDYPLEIACEVFTRINTGGTELTLFEIMVAKTYDDKKNFDLAKKYKQLVTSDNGEKCLQDAQFETIPSSTVLQCVSAHVAKSIRRQDILKLKKTKFINAWPEVVDGIFHAVDFFRRYLHLPVSQLLPYNAVMVPITYFFTQSKQPAPSTAQIKWLKQYFYWVAFSSRFSSGVEGKVAFDLRRMENILANKSPLSRGEELKLTLGDIEETRFSTSDAFCKGILCILASRNPMTFDGEGEVELSNAWLRRANSRNFHHFFPKAFLKKKGYEDWEANLVLNITMVTNKENNSIKAKAPKVYIKKYANENKRLSKTMQSHYIGNLTAFGVLDNDYEKFIEMRGKRIVKEINKVLNPMG